MNYIKNEFKLRKHIEKNTLNKFETLLITKIQIFILDIEHPYDSPIY